MTTDPAKAPETASSPPESASTVSPNVIGAFLISAPRRRRVPSSLTFAPVHVWETASRKRTITTVNAAARILIERWPGDDTPLARKAREMCVAAMEGKATAADVREALIKAAKAANIYADK
jgi:hypothetical protein